MGENGLYSARRCVECMQTHQAFAKILASFQGLLDLHLNIVVARFHRGRIARCVRAVPALCTKFVQDHAQPA